MRERYGLDEPILVQYWKWISGVVVGDFGMSMEWRRPVSELIWGRMGLSFCVAFASVLFVWALALPMGIYSAVRKYTIGDYIITAIGFVGLAIPNFLFALVLLYVGVIYFGVELTGLFSPEYANAPWSWAKVGGPGQAPLDPGRDHRHLGHGEPDPDHARQPARRAAQALCHHRTREGAPRVEAAPALPGARRPEPVRLDDRLGVPQHHQRLRSSPTSC